MSFKDAVKESLERQAMAEPERRVRDFVPEDAS